LLHNVYLYAASSGKDDTVPGNALGGDGLDDVRRARAGNPVAVAMQKQFECGVAPGVAAEKS
jgi:hypothetical protein